MLQPARINVRTSDDLGGALGEGGVAEVVQRFDRPVAAQQVGQADGVGQLQGEAGDRVDVTARHLLVCS